MGLRPLDGGDVIPLDENHIHLEEGETTAALDLEVGVHTLCLQLADENEIALDNRGATDIINLIVVEGAGTADPNEG